MNAYAEAAKLMAQVQKAGARHSSKDNSLIQQLHDLSCELGAECPMKDMTIHPQLKAAVEALVLRHPGHGNQKVHGNRFGGYGTTKESLRRLKDDKGAREKYKESARKKAAGSRSSEALKDVDLKPSGSIGEYRPKAAAGTRERLNEITASQLTGELQDRFISPKQKDLQAKWDKANKQQDRVTSQRLSKELGRVVMDDLKRALHLTDRVPVFSNSKGGARAENIKDISIYGRRG